jgi:hypothetical protein
VGDARLWFLEMVQELQRRHDQQEPCRRAPPDGPRLSKPARRQRRGRRRRSTREDVKVWDRARVNPRGRSGRRAERSCFGRTCQSSTGRG